VSGSRCMCRGGWNAIQYIYAYPQPAVRHKHEGRVLLREMGQGLAQAGVALARERVNKPIICSVARDAAVRLESLETNQTCAAVHRQRIDGRTGVAQRDPAHGSYL
jgi:hypothetical protein